MKEVNFQDRVPTYPGRIYLTPVVGQENTFDMVRADEPDAEGTPLDKATFNSIIHSRLTGRYYEPTVAYNALTSQVGVKTNPLPSSSWVMDGETKMKSGSYLVEASSVYSANGHPLDEAFDGSLATYWESAGEAQPWLRIQLPQELTVKKIKMRVDSHSTSYPPITTLQGSNNGTTWTNLLAVNGRQTSLTEYTLTTTGAFKYYRLSFAFSGLDEGHARIYAFEFSEYDFYQYRTELALNDVPTKWDVGQRLLIQTPALSTVSVLSNTLNGITVKTILQSLKQYELRYNGSSFDVKEV